MPSQLLPVELLRMLVAKDAEYRDAGRDPSFILMQVSGGGVNLKPGIPAQPTQADIRDLIESHDLRDITSTPPQPSVVLKFEVTAQGRRSGQPRREVPDPGPTAQPASRPPASTPVEVLRWLADLEDQSSGALGDGEALVDQISAVFGEEQMETVCRRIVDMASMGLVLFTDPAGHLPQFAPSERLKMASEFRLTIVGRDRLEPAGAPANVTQIINAVNAQVAAGDITNYVSFTALLDDVQRHLDDLTDIDDNARTEAQGILDKLRSAGMNVTTTAMGSGGGAVIGALLAHLLGIHT